MPGLEFLDAIHCDCSLEGLLRTYLEDAQAEGVDTTSEQRDLTDLTAFDISHLRSHLFQEQDTAPAAAEGSEQITAAPEEAIALPAKRTYSESGATLDGTASPPKPAKRFRLPHRDGRDWGSLTFSPAAQPSNGSPDKLRQKNNSTPATPTKKPKKHTSPNKHPSHRGKGSKRPRGPDADSREAKHLLQKWLGRGLIFRSEAYSMQLHGSRVSTGWHGLNPSKMARAEVRQAWASNSIKATVAYFFPVYADLQRPGVLLDSDSRIFLYRSTQPEWLVDCAESFQEAADRLLEDTLASAKVKRDSLYLERGPHFPCIIGHYRQYAKRPFLTKWHRENEERVDEFLKNKTIIRLNNWVSSIVRLVFPGVAERFNATAKWHEEKYGIRPLFGQFWNFCINGMFPGQKRIHCKPHADSRNIVGICVLVIYELPGKKFNHARRSWLVLWEAGVAIQLPPWTMVCYPSSLLYHFNIDVTDFKFVTTKGDERPTPENWAPIEEGDDEGRGSLVYFNQASMYQSAETDSETLAEAAKKGYSRKVDYGSSAQKAFTSYSTFGIVPHS